MAKTVIKNYIFHPGIGLLDNNNPNAYDLFLKNKDFIIQEAIYFINQEINDSEKCQRDIDYIIEGCFFDVAFGCNYNARFLGFTELNSQDLSNTVKRVIQKTQEEILKLTSVNNSEQSTANVNTYFDEILNIINNGENSASALNLPSPSTAPNNNKNTKERLLNNINFLSNEVNAYVALNYPNSDHNVDKCTRDITYIIQSLAYDIIFGGNSATWLQGKIFYYYKDPEQVGITENHLSATIGAYTHLKNLLEDIIRGVPITPTSGNTESQDLTGGNGTSSESSYLESLIDFTINIISAESLSAADAILNGLAVIKPNISFWASGELLAAASDIETNQTSLKNNSVISDTYTYNTEKCERDINYILEGYLYDLRYGGNEKTYNNIKYYWDNDVAQIDGNRVPEYLTHLFIKDLLNDFILTNTIFAKLGPLAQVIDDTKTAETDSFTIITQLTNATANVINKGLDFRPSLEVSGISNIKFIGSYEIKDVLIITNITKNEIIYNFSDANLGGKITKYKKTTLHDNDYPTFLQTTDAINVLELNFNTSTHLATDDIQIFIEETDNGKSTVITRPFEFGTDAIERTRSSQPLSMIDADFEYGLQPTKWAAISTLRGYPSIYEIPGTDLPVLNVVTDASVGTDGVGPSLITVTCTSNHNISLGTPVTIKGLLDSVSGSARAEGSFVVVSIPTPQSFTYYAKAKVGTSTASITTPYTQVRIGGFYTGANIGNATFSVITQGSSAITFAELFVPIGSTVFPYSGPNPEIQSPVNTDSTTAFPSGTQVTNVISVSSGGGIYITKDLEGDYEIGSTYIDVTDPTGLLDDLGLDRGDGQATFIQSIDTNRVYLTDALTSKIVGAQTSYTNIAGTNIQSLGQGVLFDINATGSTYNVSVNTLGTDYLIGDKLLIEGINIGGQNPANDLSIIVDSVDSNGGIITFTETGTAFSGTATINDIQANVSNNTGTGNSFDITWTNTVYSVVVSTPNNSLGYSVGDKIKIEYTQLVDVTEGTEINDLVLNVNSIDVNGEILTVTIDSGIGPDVVRQWLNPAYSTSGSGTITFLDIRQNGTTYTIDQINSSDFVVTDTILILGTDLNGGSPANDMTITVLTVDQDGQILTYSISGTANNESSATGIVGNNLNGSGAVFSIDLASGSYSNIIIQNGGTNFAVGQQITIDGSLLLGVTSINDLIIEVATVNNYQVTNFTIISGLASTSIGSYTITAINVVPVGIHATFNIDRNAGSYTNITLNTAGDFYKISDRIKILGTELGGSTPLDDLTIIVSTVNNGQIATFSNSYTSAALGTSVNFLCTFTTTESNIEDINQGDSIPFNAIATIGVTFQSPHGLVPGSTFIVGIDSDNGLNNHELAGGSFIITNLPDLYNLRYQARAEGFIDLDYQGVDTPTTQYNTDPGNEFYWETGIVVVQLVSGNYIKLLWNGVEVLYIDSINNPAEYATITGPNPDRYTVSTDLWYERGTQIISDPSYNQYEIIRTDVIQTPFDPIAGFVYPKPDSFFVHRPFDGGVQLGTGGPQHGAQAIRQSKKYIRYQSGKGIMYTTGALFAPSYDLRSVESDGIEVGSNITITLDDNDHGVQEGGIIRLSNIKTPGYNSGPQSAVPPEFDYTVTEVINERTFKIQAQRRLGATSAALDFGAQMSVVSWHGATVRSGVFDDQNGIFWEYDGTQISVVLRYATSQLTGTVSVYVDSNIVTGSNTRFRDQLKAGDKVVIKGMTHVVTNVFSDTQCYVTPDWRGVSNITGAKMALVVDKKVKQSEFNLDKIDGTGPSGYNIDISKMQMIGIQYSWYGAGFIDFMLRGSDGNFLFVHRMRNSNVNTEAFMRSGNLPVRYEVSNEGPSGKLSADLGITDTELSLSDSSFFPNSGTLYIDNEIIKFTVNNKNTNTLSNLQRAATFNNYQAGANRAYTAAVASEHLKDTGVILISQTITPLISHWGSAMLTDGGFDSDRGYIFSYTTNSVEVSTTPVTAFLIRLSPSVSNAIIGDLGERELLNRAQLLLQSIEMAIESGTGAVIVEGILNPINYPQDPNAVSWSGLSSSAQGGQPSFTQIASGGGIDWGVVSSSTSTITVIGDQDSGFVFNGTATERYSPLELDPTDFNTNGAEIGAEIWSQNPDAFSDSNEIFYVTQLDKSTGKVYYISSDDSTRSQTNTFSSTTFKFIFRGYTGKTNRILVAKADWDLSNGGIGTPVATSDTNWPANTAVSNIIARQIGPTEFYEIIFNQTSVATLSIGSTVTLDLGSASYATPGETIFSFIGNPGSFNNLDLSELKELTNTPLGGRGTYPNGPDILAINIYKVTGSPVNASIILRWGEAQA